MKLPVLALAAAGLLSLGSAEAMIVNISATSDQPTVVTLDAGTYAWNWIGTAEGGAYDAWSYNTAASGNWRAAFTLSVSYFGMTQSVVIDTVKPASGFAADGRYHYSNYATAADALAAFQNGSYTAISLSEGAENGPFTAAEMQIVVPPFPFTLSFSVPDEFRSDNTGGVSLNISAIPEPGTYTLMLAGLAVIAGLALRRMRRDE